MPRFRILRQIPEVFTVEAETYDQAVEKIANGEIEESEGLSDTYELVEEVNEERGDSPCEGIYLRSE